MFDQTIERRLTEITLAYQQVCLDYIVEVGKFGSGNNGITVQWSITSHTCKKLRDLVKHLKSSYLGRTREEKYYLLREMYALKPGVHERFYYNGHVGRVLEMLQEVFSSKNSLVSKGTLFLKHMLTLENFYDLEPFYNVSERCCFPSTPRTAQAATKFFLGVQNWEALDQLKPLDSWLPYASCAINEGPLVQREGIILFENLEFLDLIAVDYREVIKLVPEMSYLLKEFSH